ncbi:alpha/beta hydrolase [uncultured Sphingorhabdus sp.]|uniref:alpha/beta hydrolase n=1 Tax=uncultured Sphingorhabdus sp. TaxID=1686106 RepID=UPI0026133428|nr:alpha/beta hydrolase [uncultured Sphingorhabdus sp.]HMS19866.1 alpha/beta hydrolase [Sphingorhabdus sp.]
MPLNPQVEALLQFMAQAPQIDFATATPAEVRAAYDQSMLQGEPPKVASVRDIAIALDGRTLDARLYVPDGLTGTPGLTLFYHGGGWVIGTLDTHDATCRALAQKSGHAVLSVAYRLAPEHRYPTATEDSYAALCWAADNAGALGVDGACLAVAGDSAGGNLAAAVSLMARDRGGPVLRHQLLIYPVTDQDYSFASYEENGGGEYFLGTDSMRWFWGHYLGEQATADAPYAAVLRSTDLSGLPSATVIAAEFDPLRDEGMAYAEKLQAAGVATDAVIAPGMIHGFFSMFEAVPDAWEWIDRGAANLKKALA